MSDTFKALVLDEDDGKVSNQIKTWRSTICRKDVLVRVEYSDVNYKDGGLSTESVDCELSACRVSTFREPSRSRRTRATGGDKVVLTGWRVGEVH